MGMFATIYAFVFIGFFMVLEFTWLATRMTFLAKELIAASWVMLHASLLALIALTAVGPMLAVEMMAVMAGVLAVFLAAQTLFARVVLRQSLREYCASRDAESEEWRRQRAAKKAGAVIRADAND